MKRVLWPALACVLLFASSTMAQAQYGEARDIRRNALTDTTLADSGGTTWVTEADLWQGDGYWTSGIMTVIDQSSAAADSVVPITGFNNAADSVIFAAFGVAVAKTDSLEFWIDLGTNPSLKMPTWVIDSLGADTSETFRMTPGAAITTSMLITVGDNEDSADTKIVLEVALVKQLGDNAGWMRIDSITYAEQDTIIYKAWGAVQANYFRFILDPVDAPFSASHTAIFYGKVLVDK